MLKEFKDFVMRGNVIDMAVGVVIGGAFSAIVNALVESMIMPVVTALTAGVNFADLKFTIGEVDILYGQVINATVSFLIIAAVLFLVVKATNKLTRSEEADAVEAAPTTKTCPFCLSEVPAGATRCAHCTSELK